MAQALLFEVAVFHKGEKRKDVSPITTSGPHVFHTPLDVALFMANPPMILLCKLHGTHETDRLHPDVLAARVEFLSAKVVPFPKGTSIKTTQPNPTVNDWTDEAVARRKWGVRGKIAIHHDSHGLCYDVRHEDGSLGTYDPSELEVTQ